MVIYRGQRGGLRQTLLHYVGRVAVLSTTAA